MARKPGAGTKKKGGGAARRQGGSRRKPGIRERIVTSALDLAGERGWRAITLAAIAERAGATLGEIIAEFPSKAAILGGILGHMDQAVIAGGAVTASDDASARDRLFDVLMRRFDALAAHRAGIAAIVRDGLADPVIGLCALPRFMASMATMLEAADIPVAGIPGLARTKVLAAVYLGTLRVWLGDDTPDMARTMAALDKSLRRAEWLASLLPGGGGRNHDGGAG